MKAIRLSGVRYEMAKEKMKGRKMRTVEEYIEMLIQEDFYGKQKSQVVN
jgi:hypothetical protein